MTKPRFRIIRPKSTFTNFDFKPRSQLSLMVDIAVKFSGNAYHDNPYLSQKRILTIMHLINRAALIIRPKQPFIDWASNTDEEAGMSAQFLKDEFQIYLVPEDPKGESEIPPLDNVFEEIFMDQLFGWNTDDSSWPEPITLELFHEWFDVQGNSMVMDLGNTSIYRERLD